MRVKWNINGLFCLSELNKPILLRDREGERNQLKKDVFKVNQKVEETLNWSQKFILRVIRRKEEERYGHPRQSFYSGAER